jgi:hypothetical protein
METLRAVYRRIAAVGRRVQARVVLMGLWLLYWLGFGPVRVLVAFFRPELLEDPAEDAPSFWLEVPPQDYDPSTLPHQS